jgi:hypothetical protein
MSEYERRENLPRIFHYKDFDLKDTLDRGSDLLSELLQTACLPRYDIRLV